MRLTARERYAVRAMAALAAEYGRGPMALPEVADSQGIPFRYLEHIAQDLRRSGLIRSRRGAAGGYELAAPPDAISVADLFRALDGDILPVGCGEAPGCSFSNRLEACAARPLWQGLRQHLERSLAGVTLAELAQNLLSRDADERQAQDG